MDLNKKRSSDAMEMVKQESKEEKDKSNGYDNTSDIDNSTTEKIKYEEKHMTEDMKSKADQKAKIEYYKFLGQS